MSLALRHLAVECLVIATPTPVKLPLELAPSHEKRLAARLLDFDAEMSAMLRLAAV